MNVGFQIAQISSRFGIIIQDNNYFLRCLYVYSKNDRYIKGACPIFQNLVLYRGSVFHLKDHHTKDVNLKFQLNWSNRLVWMWQAILYIAIAYMITT